MSAEALYFLQRRYPAHDKETFQTDESTSDKLMEALRRSSFPGPFLFEANNERELWGLVVV